MKNPDLIEEKVTSKAIIPVSLYGQPTNIQSIADLKVIIDGAQSFGSTFKGFKFRRFLSKTIRLFWSCIY